jgi:hypothetical protein
MCSYTQAILDERTRVTKDIRKYRRWETRALAVENQDSLDEARDELNALTWYRKGLTYSIRQLTKPYA